MPENAAISAVIYFCVHFSFSQEKKIQIEMERMITFSFPWKYLFWIQRTFMEFKLFSYLTTDYM